MGWPLIAGMQEATQEALELQLEGEAEQFFSQPPGAWEVVHDDWHDDWHPEPLSSLERIAMLTTAAPGMAMLAVAITLLLTEAWLTAAPQQSAMPLQALAHAATAPAFSDAVVHEQPPLPRTEEPSQAARQPPVASHAPIASAASVPAVVPRRSGKRARSPVTRAGQLLDAGRTEEARDLARSAIRDAPHKAGGYIVLAAALDKLGDRAGRKATFRSCVELAKDPLASACRSLAR